MTRWNFVPLVLWWLFFFAGSCVGRPCPHDCFGHGECRPSGKCLCNIGYFHDCEKNAEQIYGSLWLAGRVVFTVIFGIVAFVALFQLMVLTCRYKKSSKLRKALILSIFLGSFIGCLYEAIDPFGFSQIFPPILEGILYQIIAAFIATAYALLIAFWGNVIRVLYAQYSQSYFVSTCPLITGTITGLALIWIFFIVAAVCIKAVSLEISRMFLSIYILVLGMYLLLMALGFFLCGIKIYKAYSHIMEHHYVNTDKKPRGKSRVKKITRLAVVASAIMVITMISLVLSAPFALDQLKEPLLFVVFQVAYRVEQLVFCIIIVRFAGTWNPKSWTRRNPDKKQDYVVTLNGDIDPFASNE